jgi:hypothetical protein
MIVRDGRRWCLKHDRPWRECPCVGDVSISATIDQAAIDAVTPQQGAFTEFAERAIAQADGSP